MQPNPRNTRVIYDVLYGFIPITEWEEKIINSPFFQRLRWIKQLGFANYIFPGAEHNRYHEADRPQERQPRCEALREAFGFARGHRPHSHSIVLGGLEEIS